MARLNVEMMSDFASVGVPDGGLSSRGVTSRDNPASIRTHGNGATTGTAGGPGQIAPFHARLEHHESIGLPSIENAELAFRIRHRSPLPIRAEAKALRDESLRNREAFRRPELQGGIICGWQRVGQQALAARHDEARFGWMKPGSHIVISGDPERWPGGRQVEQLEAPPVHPVGRLPNVPSTVRGEIVVPDSRAVAHRAL